MRVINSNATYEIYDDNLRIYENLPPQCYTIRFSKMTGFFLEKHADIEINESKIYGVHDSKVAKVLKSFALFHRSLGVILSGDKGIGKSLFAKLLSIRAIEQNLPLIIVDTYYPGIASYIESIEQEVVILFDEFDKTFAGKENDPQAEMLSLFDGIAGGKKLFVITCNEIRKLNDYLVNRPGRFHYHFRFNYPSAEEVREYLQDKLERQYWGEISKVILFSKKINLNYDCLRSIAFELNNGESFENAIQDLNIININREKYRATLWFANNVVMTNSDVNLDLFDRDATASIYMYDKQNKSYVTVSFDHSNCIYDPNSGQMIVPKECLNVEFDADDDYYKKEVEAIKNVEAIRFTLERAGGKHYHYAV